MHAHRPEILCRLGTGISRFCCTAIVLFSACAFAADPYRAPGADGVVYSVGREGESLTVQVEGKGVSQKSFFIALGGPDHAGAFIVPFEKGGEGSTVFLPFAAQTLLQSTPDGTTLRRWLGTKWGNRAPAGADVSVRREGDRISVTLPSSLVGPADGLRLAAYLKDPSAAGGWGVLSGAVDPADPGGVGDIVLRGYLGSDGATPALRRRNAADVSKPRIYQFLPRHFGNTNETRKPNGFLEENGVGKFSDMGEAALASLKEMGFTHIWPTGVLQQATATGYEAIGEPADDPDLLKGLAGSPYAIKDYFDVCPDYAVDPASRLEEFRALIGRAHAAGLKVLIDLVPNHVARSYNSTVRPDLNFGNQDDHTKYLAAGNNFYWLTPEAKPFGKGPPLRLPTVDSEGRPTSPTCKVAKAPSDGLFAPESEHGRVTGSSLASWEPDPGSWYETVKLNYGFDFAGRQTRLYPHGDQADLPIPDTWKKMDEIIAHWQGFGVDGFRVDMAHMVPPEFWHWAIARARSRKPDAYFVAEAYDTDPGKVPSGDSLAREAGGGNVMFDLLNAGFNSVYDDATYDKVKEIYEGGAWANDLDAIAARPFVFDNSLRYAENHDEVRLAAKSQWGGIGKEVGRPVTALLFGLSRGPVMVYSGQEVGEPADGAEGFGEDDARTSIFDYWSMPEFTKWVNGKKFDGGGLAPDQVSLREFYSRLVRLVNEPAFRNGDFFPLNPANAENPAFGRSPEEKAGGHWIYSFLRRDPASGQKFLVVINLHRSQMLDGVRVVLPPPALDFLGLKPTSPIQLSDRLSGVPEIRTSAAEASGKGIPLPPLPPLTPCFFEMTE